MSETAVKTSSTRLRFAPESSPGVLGNNNIFRVIEADSIDRFGSELTLSERNPITAGRRPQKGNPVSQASGVEFAAVAYQGVLSDVLKQFLLADWTGDYAVSVAAVTGTGYTIPAGNPALTAGQLVYAEGFDNDANNGVKIVTAGSTATSLRASGLVAGSGQNGRVSKIGYRATGGDLDIDANGDITSTTANLTSIGLQVGQFIYVQIGNSARTKANSADAFARIKSISQNKIVLDSWGNQLAATTGSITMDIYASSFIKDAKIGATDFVDNTTHFELEQSGLADASSITQKVYEYINGARLDTLALSLPLQDLIRFTASYQAAAVEAATETAKTATREEYVKRDSFNTANNIPRAVFRRADGTVIVDLFKELTINLSNNVEPENILGKFEANEITFGQMGVAITGSALFRRNAIHNVISENESIDVQIGIENGQGGFILNAPSVALSGGQRQFPANRTITIQLDGNASEADDFDSVLGVSKFYYLPDIT